MPTPGFDINELKRRMQGATQSLKHELGGLRTGRAAASMLEPVQVDAYGSHMPLNQVATISVPEPRLITTDIRLSDAQFRFVLADDGFRLSKGFTKRPGVDFKQKVALRNRGPFGKLHTEQRPSDLRLNTNTGKGFDISDGPDLNRNELLLCLGRIDRYRRWNHRARIRFWCRTAGGEDQDQEQEKRARQTGYYFQHHFRSLARMGQRGGIQGRTELIRLSTTVIGQHFNGHWLFGGEGVFSMADVR